MEAGLAVYLEGGDPDADLPEEHHGPPARALCRLRADTHPMTYLPAADHGPRARMDSKITHQDG